MQDAKRQHQMELERLFNKNQLLPRIRAEFTDCEDFDFTKYIESKGGTASQPVKRWTEFKELLSSPRLPSGLK